MANSQAAYLYTLTNANGMKVNITNYGGVVQSIFVPSRDGTMTNVALGFPSLADYVNDFTQGANQTPWPLPGGSGNTYFGAIIGRYANRIANASFTMSCDPKVCANNGVTYTLDANNGANTLHGGYLGWNTAVWSATPVKTHFAVGLQLTNTFPAGEGCFAKLTGAVCNTPTGGFPAPVKATVTYLLTNNNALKMVYNVVNLSSTDATVLNVTNHTYFNLAGEGSGSVYHQYLAINANQYQPVNLNLIPTNFANVAGTAYDFRTMKPIGQDIRNANLPDGGTQAFPQLVIAHGYDNNWVLNGSGYRLDAVAMDKKTGIVLSEFTDQPGVQFYSGNFLVGDLVGTSGYTYRQSDGFTLETQHYPDAPHHIGDPAWPSVVLNPGATFNSTTAYQFSLAGRHHHSRRF
ncbi:MAG TPA: aldose epimerase family protein [Solirubrobacteraceae bacterium]|nr:aldose epimerase family protein [Solirubrobacteraceae bacterium]